MLNYMKKFVITLFAVVAFMSLFAQEADTQVRSFSECFERLMDKRHYSDAYALADSLYVETDWKIRRLEDEKGKDPFQSKLLILSTWCMERAAVHYQEDAYDSAMARYGAILPFLTPADRALCYLFMGKADSALADSVMLRMVPTEGYECFMRKGSERGDSLVNLTPTLYELVVKEYRDDYRYDIESRIAVQRGLVNYWRGLVIDNGGLKIDNYGGGRSTAANSQFSILNSQFILIHAEIVLAGLIEHDPKFSEKDVAGLYGGILSRYRDVRCDELAWVYYKLAEACRATSEDWEIGRLEDAKGKAPAQSPNLRISESPIDMALAYCDTAMRLCPGSEGAVSCARLRDDILRQEMGLRVRQCYAGEGEALATLTARNVSRAYFRVVPRVAKGKEGDRESYLRQRCIASWSQDLGDSADHREHGYFVYLPALPYGDYTLLASWSDDFKEAGFEAIDFVKQEAVFRVMPSGKERVQGCLLDYETGAPIAGQEVSLWKSSKKDKLLATAITDKEGYFAVPISEADYRGYSLMTTLHGRKISESGRWYYYRGLDFTDRKAFTDRPIYRPGDTVHITIISSKVKGNREGHVMVGDTLKVFVRNPNYMTVDSAMLVTDAHGQAVYDYVIAPDALPGNWLFACSGMLQEPFRVEAYKQPKFAVALNVRNTLDKAGNPVSPMLGDTIVVAGTAASYSGVSLAGAEVRYSVERMLSRYSRARVVQKTIVTDTLWTDAEGCFRIAFVAVPDSMVDLSANPTFAYTVKVEVTDVNGETHSQSVVCAAGYETAYVSIEDKDECAELSKLSYQYRDYNGNPLRGKLHLTVERLEVPKTAYLQPGLAWEGVKHTMSEAEFHEHYPLLAYNGADQAINSWPVAKKVYQADVEAAMLTSNSVALPKLTEGCYRFILTDGRNSDTAYTDYMPMGTAHVHTSNLLWSDISARRAEVGETVTLRVGSRYHDVDVVYMLATSNEVIDRRIIRLNDNVTAISIPVTEALLGGFTVSVAAVKCGIDEVQSYRIDVPFTHKKLDIQLTTFRDKLAPGEKETWEISVKGHELGVKDGVPSQNCSRKELGSTPGSKRNDLSMRDSLSARLTLSMYDASLDSYYGGLSYNWSPWRSTIFSPIDGISFNHYWYPKDFFKRKTIDYPKPRNLFYESSLFMPGLMVVENDAMIMNKVGMMRKSAVPASRSAVVAAVGGVGYDNGRIIVEEVEEEMVFYAAETVASADAKQESVPTDLHLRTNLSTLAFFEPQLHTDAEGRITYSFTAPDLLTKWNIRGFAWTDDLATGSLAKSLVTQKQLMIQPNMPRFLREGDEAQLLAKVANQTDSTLQVTVACELAIPGQPLPTSTQQLTLKPHAIESVAFPVTATTGGIMATYKMVAYGDHHSDGEQGPLPLLTNRQAVTTSVSMFMNGVNSEMSGSHNSQIKQYAIPLPLSSTAQPVGFTVEYTANPFWLAVQTLPFLSERENPSTIYLANSIYVNTLGKAVADSYPELKQAAAEATDTSSVLFANADVKNTLLSETPWLRAGQSEAERLRRIANFYDTVTLQHQLEEACSKLAQSQLSDGSWPWMPEGRDGSLYTTQYILRTLAPLVKSYELRVKNGTPSHDHSLVVPGSSPCPNRNAPSIRDSLLTLNSALLTLPKALSYVDQKQYEYYQRIEKQNKRGGCSFEPDCLDYLYTRSFFDDKLSKRHQEAYDFFYNNAKQHLDSYESLYSQALLALVFQRHGDTNLARTLVERIKQKALYSDEMGMYWRDNRSGWFYYQRPVETQALLIETFREVLPSDTLSVGLMQQWLLKQKQTTSWNTDIATLRAIQALMPSVKSYELRVKSGTPSRDNSLIPPGGTPVRSEAGSSSCSNRKDQTIRDSLLTLNSALLTLYIEPDTLRFPIGKDLPVCYDSLVAPQNGAGYIRHTYRGDSLQALLGVPEIRVTLVSKQVGRLEDEKMRRGRHPFQSSNLPISQSSIGWGALYYQYTEQMDKIEASATGITITQELFIVAPDGTLRPTDGKDLAVGDRLRIIHHLSCDRNMEYLQFKRFRASCLEPVSTASGWTWSRGFSYYVAISDSHDDLYINRLDKGKYVIEADYYVTNPGTFTLAPSVMQCLYAPEFRATTQGGRVEVK